LVTEQLTYISPKRLLKLDRLIDKISIKKKGDRKKIFGFLKKGLKSEKKNVKEGYAKKIVWKLATRIYNKCDKIIVPSKAIKTVLKEHGIKKEIVVVSNGIILNLFKPKNNYKENFKLICIGRISYEKNIDVVIKSVDIVRQIYPSIILEIIGPGPALPSLKKLVRSLSLTRNVKFLGKVDYKKLSPFYRKGDIFLTASTMETQGLVILEAMACGLPIIGVKKYAIPDLVINNRNGYVVKPFNERKMAGKTIALLENPKLLKKFGKESAKLAKLHDVNKMSKKLEVCYKSMLKST
jgi:glycosyltransferase involved in cell wall biosynthesis